MKKRIKKLMIVSVDNFYFKLRLTILFTFYLNLHALTMDSGILSLVRVLIRFQLLCREVLFNLIQLLIFSYINYFTVIYITVLN